MAKEQIKSRDRVKDHGEVYTNEREVNAMLDMVKAETENIESTFLEPACGDGNFLAEIIKRKMAVVKERYKILDEYELQSIAAISSIYGVDILEDNVEICINRLFNIWSNEYKSVMKSNANEKTMEAAKYILSKNILCGDALTMFKNDGTPIVFAEWQFPKGTMVKRRDYQLADILKAEEMVDTEDFNLFTFDEDIKADVRESMDRPIKEYPLVDFKEVQKYD